MRCRKSSEQAQNTSKPHGSSGITRSELDVLNRSLNIPPLYREGRSAQGVAIYTLFSRMCQNANLDYNYLTTVFSSARDKLRRENMDELKQDAARMCELAQQHNIPMKVNKLTKDAIYGLACLYREFVNNPEYKTVEFFHQIIPADLREKKYYHGTDKEKNGIGIMQDEKISAQTYDKNNYLTPVPGKAYLATDAGYSLIYALGGVLMGSEIPESWIKTNGRYGYIFEIDGTALDEIQPDEDAIGELIDKGLHQPVPELEWLYGLARRYLTPNELKKVKSGEFIYYAKTGKKLVSLMSDDEKFALIRYGASVAHHGDVKPSGVYRIDKCRSKELAKDGSNLFEIAESIN